MNLLIIQPWFCAIGNPAQSLINLASIIGRDERVEFLVHRNGESVFVRDSMEQLRAWCEVESYAVTTPVGDSNTVRALLALWRMRLNGRQYQRVFFFDESLFVLALLCATAERYLTQCRTRAARRLLTLTSPSNFSRSW